MHFGEYELSPSLIGLSPLPTAHPGAFQRPLVRTSTRCYPGFILAGGRSHGFASAASDSLAPFSDSLSLRLARVDPLNPPDTATRRLIMQKARRHAKKRRSDRLEAYGFRSLSLPCAGCFSPFPHGTRPLSVSQKYLALADGPAGFTQGFTCPALLRDGSATPENFAHGAFTLYGRTFQSVMLTFRQSHMPPPYNPRNAPMARPGFGLFPFRSPLLGESLLFSLPAATKMFQFAAFASHGLIPQDAAP